MCSSFLNETNSIPQVKVLRSTILTVHVLTSLILASKDGSKDNRKPHFPMQYLDIVLIPSAIDIAPDRVQYKIYYTPGIDTFRYRF